MAVSDALLSGSGAHTTYHQHMKSKSSSWVYSDQEAGNILLTDPKVIYFGSAIAFAGDPAVKSLPNMQEAVSSQLSFALQKNSEFKGKRERIYRS